MPAARRTDPITSHEAAASVKRVTATQQAILKCLRRPANDTELVERYRNLKGAPLASDSGIRSRRAELVALGLVADSGHRDVLPSGRQAVIWEAAYLSDCHKEPATFCQCDECSTTNRGFLACVICGKNVAR